MEKENGIQALYDEGVAKGHFVKRGDNAYELTEQGLAHGIEKVYGGQDLVNLTAAIIEMVAKEGAAGFGPGTVPNKALNSMAMHSVVHAAVKKLAERCRSEKWWEEFVTQMEKDYLESTTYFKVNPRAFSSGL